MLSVSKTLAGAALVATAFAAQAVTITFDDLSVNPGSSVSIPGGYQGFTWSNAFVLNTSGYSGNPSGYQVGAVSDSQVAFNGYENPMSFSSTTAFTFNSVYLTAAWNDGLSVTLTGSEGGSTLYTQTVNPLASVPTLYTFNWSGIDTVTINTFGGTDHIGYPGAGTHVAMDNLTVNAVPEPETYAMMLAGLGALGFIGKRRRAG